MDVVKLTDEIEFDPERRVRKALFKSPGVIAEMVCYEPGQDTVPHHHPKQDEIFYVVEGRGKILIEDQEIAVEPTSMVFVPAMKRHSVVADPDSRLVIIFVKNAPPPRRPKA